MEKMILNGLIWLATYYITLKLVINKMYNPKKIKYYSVEMIPWENEVITECDTYEEFQEEKENGHCNYCIKGEIIYNDKKAEWEEVK